MPNNQMPEPTSRRHNLQLAASTAALARTTTVSNRITFPFRLQQCRIHFPLGCEHAVRVYVILSPDPSAPTDALPGGLTLLSHLSPTPYCVGDNEIVSLDFNIPIPERGFYIKMHVHNLDSYSHRITAQINLNSYPDTE